MKEKVGILIDGWWQKYKDSDFLKKISSVLLIDVLVKLSGIILLPVYLRLMTQEEYGIYNYILSIVTTFTLILTFGLYVSQSKYYSSSDTKEKKQTVVFNIFVLLSSLLVLVIIPVYAFKLDFFLVKLLFKNDITYNLYRWPILLAIIVSIYIVLLSNFFVTSEQIGYFRKYNIIRLMFINVIALLSLYFLKTDHVQIRLLYTYLTEFIVLASFMYYYFKEMRPQLDKKVLYSSFKLGIPIMFSAIWGLISNYSDKFYLEKYGSPKDLSYYYLAFSVSNILYMICAAVQNIWLPTFLKEKNIERNADKTIKLLVKLGIALAVVGALLFLGVFAAIKIHVISDQYTPALYILPILLIAQIINGIVLIYSNYMIYFEKTHWSLYIGIITSLIGIAGGYFLIPVWNIFGAAIVYLVVQLTYIIIYHYLIKLKLSQYKKSSLS